jgi:hypothetical protein
MVCEPLPGREIPNLKGVPFSELTRCTSLMVSFSFRNRPWLASVFAPAMAQTKGEFTHVPTTWIGLPFAQPEIVASATVRAISASPFSIMSRSFPVPSGTALNATFKPCFSKMPLSWHILTGIFTCSGTPAIVMAAMTVSVKALCGNERFEQVCSHQCWESETK